MKIFISFLMILINLSAFSDNSKDISKVQEKKISLGGGYSQLNISNNYYTGYNLGIQFLFPMNNQFSIGFGSKFIKLKTSSGVTSTSAESISSKFTALLAGVDLAYKLSLSEFDFQINPFIYYGFYNSWTKNTGFAGLSVTQDVPITFNILFGLELSSFYNISDLFYFGPSISYAIGYLENGIYADNYNNVYKKNSGKYQIYNINITIGKYL